MNDPFILLGTHKQTGELAAANIYGGMAPIGQDFGRVSWERMKANIRRFDREADAQSIAGRYNADPNYLHTYKVVRESEAMKLQQPEAAAV